MSYRDWAWNIVKIFYINILLLKYTQYFIHGWKYMFANIIIWYFEIYIYYVCNRDCYISLSIFITSIIIDTITRNKEKIDIKNIHFVLCFYFSIILWWKLEICIYKFLLFVLYYIKCLLLLLIKLLITDAL